MSESLSPAPTVDLPSGELRARLCREFEAAWKLILEGPAAVEAYLARLPETEQAQARQEIERIDSHFRPLLTARPAGRPDKNTPSPSSETVNESQGVRIDAGATVDEASGRLIAMPAAGRRDGKPRPQVPGYEVLGELGRGGMGVVYKARHLALNRLVALKMILAGAHAEEEQLSRFYTEAQAVAKLQHPNVVQVFEISEHDGLPYFSLEFVDGGSLARKINRTPQPPPEAARLAETLARGVQAAHEKGIIHRDLKPANILLTADGVPKITDFGLARAVEGDTGQTRSGSVLGTPSYMAPEQAKGDVNNIGPLADVYALGAVLYELLTGRPPFQGASVLDTLEQVQSKEPVAPTQLSPKVPRDLETICLKCLQKERGKRYQSAKDLADDLRRFLEGRPIVARPVSAAERAWRWCRRNPSVAGLLALAVIMAVGWLVGLSVFNVQLTKKHDIAVRAQAEEAEQRKAADLARAEEAGARKAEAKARGEAENDVRAALSGLRVFVVETQKELKGRLNLTGLRARLARAALEHIDKLTGSVGTRTVKDRSTVASLVILGDLFVELGQLQKGKANYERAFALYEEMRKSDPADLGLPHNLAVLYLKRAGVAMQLDDARAARGMYEEVLRLRQDLLKRTPNKEEARKGIAEAYGYLGFACLNMGDPQAALEYLRLAQTTYDTLPPQRLRALRQQLATLQRHLGKASLQTGDVEAARKHLNEALRIQQELVKLNTSVSAWQRDLAFTLCELGDLEQLWDHNAYGAALYYREAVRRLEPLVGQAPDVSIPKEDLAFADYRLGTACQRVALVSPGLFAVPWVAASRFHFDRARTLLGPIARLDPRNSGVQIQLLFATARSSQRSEALALADRLVSGWPKDQRVLYHAACGYALCVPLGDKEEAKQLAAKALQTLERAVAGGWKDAEELRRNPELDAIRDRPEFAALQKKVEAARK